MRSNARTPAYVWLLLAAFTLNIVSGNTSEVGIPLAPDRLLFPAALLLLALDPHREKLRRRGVFWLMGALCAWATWSALSAGTLWSTYGFFALTDRIVMPMLLFAAAPLAFSTERSRIYLLRTLIVLGIYLGATAVFEIMGPHSLVFPRYILDPETGIHLGRARGPFGSAEANGMTMALIAFAAAVLVAKERWGWRLITIASGLLCGVGCILCMTRSVWLGMALGILGVAVLMPQWRRWLATSMAGLLFALVLVYATAPTLVSTLSERLFDQGTLYDRENTNVAALRIIEAHPASGIGWMTFQDGVHEWVRQSDLYPVAHVGIEIHNVFLSRAAELGLPAAAVFVAILVMGPLAAVVRGRSAALTEWRVLALAAMCVWMVPSLTSPNPYLLPNYLVWCFAGIAGRPWLVRERRPTRATPDAGHTATDNASNVHEGTRLT